MGNFERYIMHACEWIIAWNDYTLNDQYPWLSSAFAHRMWCPISCIVGDQCVDTNTAFADTCGALWIVVWLTGFPSSLKKSNRTICLQKWWRIQYMHSKLVKSFIYVFIHLPSQQNAIQKCKGREVIFFKWKVYWYDIFRS
jgi:hypothetical protein